MKMRACALCGRRVEINRLATDMNKQPIMVFHVDHAGKECEGSAMSAEAAFRMAVDRGKVAK